MKKISYSLLLLLFLSANLYSIPKWERLNGPLICSNRQFFKSGGMLFGYKISGGIEKMAPDSLNWNGYFSGLTNSSLLTFASFDKYLFTGTNGDGVFLSTNNGSAWKAVNNGLSKRIVYSLYFDNSILYAGTNNGGVFYTTDFSKNWTSINIPQTDTIIKCITVSGNNLYAGSEGNGVFISIDNGVSWSQINNGLTNLNIGALLTVGNKIYAGTQGGGLFVTTDNGSAWVQVKNGITNSYINYLLANNNDIFVSTKDGIFLSKDDGNSWKRITVDINDKDAGSMIFHNSILYSSFNDGLVYFSKDKGITWEQFGSNYRCHHIMELYVYGNNLYAGSAGYGLFLSTNNGIKWTNVYKGREGFTNILDFDNLSDTIYALSSDSGIIKTIDKGFHWFVFNSNSRNFCKNCFLIDGSDFYCGSNGFYKSNDLGSTWHEINNGINFGGIKSGKDIVSNGKFLFSGIEYYSDNLYISNNSGLSWNLNNDGIDVNNLINFFVNDDSIVYLATNYALYRSTNNGIWWDKLFSDGINALYIKNGLIFINSQEYSALYSSDNGETWNRLNMGGFTDFIISGNYLYGSTYNGVYRLDLSTLDVDESDLKESPLIYPNPAREYISVIVGANGRSPLQHNIAIYNSLGECVMESPIHPMNGIQRMNVGHLSYGLYYICIGSQCIKFVKM
jgi:photosystem II stability/assembly factor-like uncharacterized protein